MKEPYPIEDHKPVGHAEEKLMEDLKGYSFPSLDLAYDEAKEIIDFQFRSVTDLDGKAGILVGFAGVVLSTLFASVSYLSRISPDVQLRILLFSGALLVFFSGFAGLRAYGLRTYARPPSIGRLWEEYIQWHPRNFKYQMIGDAFPTAFKKNEKSIRHKVLWLKVSVTSMTIGLVGLVFAFLYGYLQRTYVFYAGVGIGLLLAVFEATLVGLWIRRHKTSASNSTDDGSGGDRKAPDIHWDLIPPIVMNKDEES